MINFEEMYSIFMERLAVKLVDYRYNLKDEHTFIVMRNNRNYKATVKDCRFEKMEDIICFACERLKYYFNSEEYVKNID